jgi:predicted Na+-dependent transporter
VLKDIRKRWFLIGLVIACETGYCTHWLGPWFPRHWTAGLVFLIMGFVGLTADFEALALAALNWKANVISLGMTYGAAPILAGLAGYALFGPDHELFKGLVLVGSTASTISSAIVYTRMAGGNHALSIVISNLSSVLSVVLTPALVGILLQGVDVQVPVMEMVVTLAICVLLPVAGAQVLSRACPKTTLLWRPTAALLSQIGILVVIFSTVCKTFYRADPAFRPEADPAFLTELLKAGPWLALASLAIYVFLSRASYGVARRAGLSAPDSVAVSYASAQKTLAATVVLAENYFTPLAALPMIIYHVVQLLYGTYDGERLRRHVETP